jgi:hypothetical protein
MPARIKELRDHYFVQLGVGWPIAKEGCHRNQQIVEQLLRLSRCLNDVVDIVGKARLACDLHPSAQTPPNGRGFIARKIMPGARAQKGEDAGNVIFRLLTVRMDQRLFASGDFGNTHNNLRNGFNEVGDTCRDRTARHHRKFRVGRVLNQDDAARFLDFFDTDRAVRARACQHDSEAIAPRLGNGAEKHVDGRALTARLSERPSLDLIAFDHEFAVGRNDVDAVRLQLGRILDLIDGHRGRGAQDFG